VVDGSFMPTSGGNPNTLTIMANAYRVADRLVKKAKTGKL
jgi:choline dehydrogenase-like flavoprotein